jgi:hypothetical protein
MNINGNVYGKNVVGKHLIMEMVNYIGGKKVNKKIKKVKDKKYKVVLSPSFPGEYRAVFEDILKELEKEVKKSE